MKIIRAFYTGWYGELVTALPPVVDGHMTPPPGAGLGTELRSDLLERRDVVRRCTRL